MTTWIPGLELAQAFYNEGVEPVLDAHFPDLAYSAALIGSGSEVLGFDNEMSADHHWGPRVMLFLRPDDYESQREVIRQTLAEHLPYEVRGFSTNWSLPDPNDGGVQHLRRIESGPVNHRVELFTVGDYFESYLGFDPRVEWGFREWLAISSQKLLATTAGAVFYDGLGDLAAIRQKLAYYPHDVWVYLLVCGWARIGQDEHLMPRAGWVGDELGSRIMAGRVAHDLMKLCFLMERRYAPYHKWFGSAFQQLDCAVDLTPILTAALAGDSWQAREEYFVQAYEYLAAMHNALGLTAPLDTKARSFHGRPFRVIAAERFVYALIEQIDVPALRTLAQDNQIGGVDQFSASTDLLSHTHITRRTVALYGEIKTGEA